MSRPHAVVVVLSCVTAGLLAAPGCVGDPPAGSDAGTSDGSNTGKYKGPCFPNDTCDKGLVCVQGAVCLMPGEEAGAPDASEAGDTGVDTAPMCKKPGDTCVQTDCCTQGSCISAGGPTRCCLKAPSATPCVTSDECCDYLGKQMMCKQSSGCCVAQGATCNQASDCCDPATHNCVGVCCVLSGKPCNAPGDCCSGTCTANTCT